MKQIVTRATVSDCFGQVCLPTGASVLLHSSMSALGKVEGGPDAVIDGILDVIGSEGTLMVPTFNYWVNELFDPAVTPSLAGLISETLRRRNTAVRSLHPTHSVAAIGDRAVEFTKDHENRGALRIGSPVDNLAKSGGHVVLLGVRHESNSTIHIGEAYAEPWYLGFPFSPSDPTEARILDRGTIRTVEIAGSQSGCSLAFNVLELPLRKNGQIVDFKVGEALCQLISAKAIIDCTLSLLREQKDILLCRYSGCFFCNNARRHRP
jgi:aminoglycoside 3-N-acetyltransferase